MPEFGSHEAMHGASGEGAAQFFAIVKESFDPDSEGVDLSVEADLVMSPEEIESVKGPICEQIMRLLDSGDVMHAISLANNIPELAIRDTMRKRIDGAIFSRAVERILSGGENREDRYKIAVLIVQGYASPQREAAMLDRLEILYAQNHLIG